MCPTQSTVILMLAILASYAYCIGVNIKDQIYVRLDPSDIPCIRFLNGTSSIGCQTSRLGSFGTLTIISRPIDVKNALDELPYGLNDIIAVVDINNVNSEVIEVLRTNDNVAGIVLIDNGTHAKVFSEDAECPNQQFSFYKERDSTCHKWNERKALHPDGLRFVAFDKPVRLLTNQTQIELVVNKCFEPFNHNLRFDGLRCMGKMTKLMAAAGNAKICLSRASELTSDGPYCEILQSTNVFGMFPPLSMANVSTPDQFVLAVRMDSFSTFAHAKGGDVSALTALISLLSVAHSIGRNMDSFVQRATLAKRQLLFAFFNGESMGYIGSSRWIWDMDQARFPQPATNFSTKSDNIRQIGLGALAFFMELQQIASVSHGPLFLHTDAQIYRGTNRTQIDTVLDIASKTAIVQFVDPTKLNYGAVPPSSYHSVLRATTNVPGVVLSSFGPGKYNYGFLNSLYDDQVRKNTRQLEAYTDQIVAAASVALHTSLSYVFNTSSGSKLLNDFKIERKYVQSLTRCFFLTDDWSCPLFRTLLNATNDSHVDWYLKNFANYLFIGTKTSTVYPSLIKDLVFNLLVHSTGQKKNPDVKTKEQCGDLNALQSVFKYIWLNEKENGTEACCYKTSIYRTYARSPAFDIPDYDFSSSKYSTWVASQEQGEERFDLYLKADYRLEFYAFLTALIVLFVSVPLNFFPKEQWFLDNSLPPGAPQPL